jgi:hypothetical protein
MVGLLYPWLQTTIPIWQWRCRILARRRLHVQHGKLMMGYAFVKVSVLQRFLAKLENNEQRPKAAKLLSVQWKNWRPINRCLSVFLRDHKDIWYYDIFPRLTSGCVWGLQSKHTLMKPSTQNNVPYIHTGPNSLNQWFIRWWHLVAFTPHKSWPVRIIFPSKVTF